MRRPLVDAAPPAGCGAPCWMQRPAGQPGTRGPGPRCPLPSRTRFPGACCAAAALLSASDVVSAFSFDADGDPEGPAERFRDVSPCPASRRAALQPGVETAKAPLVPPRSGQAARRARQGVRTCVRAYVRT